MSGILGFMLISGPVPREATARLHSHRPAGLPGKKKAKLMHKENHFKGKPRTPTQSVLGLRIKVRPVHYSLRIALFHPGISREASLPICSLILSSVERFSGMTSRDLVKSDETLSCLSVNMLVHVISSRLEEEALWHLEMLCGLWDFFPLSWL